MAKPGFKTSEFWVTAVVAIVALLGSSGVLTAGSSAEKIVGYIVAGLAAMGYVGIRGSLKRAEAVKNDVPKDDTGSDS